MKYKKIPVVVEAIQYTGGNYDEICDFIGEKLSDDIYKRLWIPTLEGYVKASVGDYIIKGIRGEFYPCKGDIFFETYEKIE